MIRRAIIFGSTSVVARKLAARLAARGSELVLVGRKPEELRLVAQDLSLRYETSVQVASHEAHADQDVTGLFLEHEPDAVVICHGVYIPQDQIASDPQAHRQMIEINYSSTVLILESCAEYFSKKGRGVIVAFSSVAGDRGRASNYSYGATKAALTAYLSGLRARLRHAGVRVLTVKPGPTQTAMTWGMSNYRRFADPDRVAREIESAMRRGCDVLYTPKKWRPIMWLVRVLPEFMFKRIRF